MSCKIPIFMAVNDLYKTVEMPSQSIFRDRGSRFIGLIYPVRSVEEVKELLDQLRKTYHDARHHCFAYRIGPEGETWRINDDGEPSGSAGKPIHGQLLSYEVSDVLAVVVRYFGGTKLGIPGLINAYRSAIRDALAANQIINRIVTHDINIAFRYDTMNLVMKIVKDETLEVISSEFGMECQLVVRMPKSVLPKITGLINQIPGIEWHEI
jgi:uncharacterized YigZ family protein